MISVTILTFNNEKTLRETLEGCQKFPEVLILDSGSTDSTLQIANEFPNVRIEKATFNGFGPMHRLASKLAKFDWIFSLDSDEIPTAELVTEILSLPLGNPSSSNTVFKINRKNFYRKKDINYGSSPDWILRIYNRTKTDFNENQVHESVITNGMHIQKLQHKIIHTPFHSLEDFLTKMKTYSVLWANQRVGKKQVSVFTAIGHSLCAFIKSYFFKRGFLLGYEGLLISYYNAHTTLYKYLLLYEKNNKV